MLQLENTSLVDMVEASYDMSEARAPWANRVIRALMTMTSSRMGAAFHFESSYEHDVFRLKSMGSDIALGSTIEAARALAANMSIPGQMSELLLGKTQGTTAAAVSRLGVDLASVPGFRDCWPAPIVDSLGFVARDVNSDGFCACVGLDFIGALTPRESRLLTRLATHVGAGDRLRRAKHLRPIDDAEAILTPNGRVLHVTEAAKNKRESLDEGRRRRAEAKKTTHDPEKALEVWQGLIAGRWSLVDHFDTDGKRFLLAMKNTPQIDRRADLTPRERRVCALVAMGHLDKEVAYMLGLSIASVTASLHRARTKLGVATRSELATNWRRGGKP